MGHVLDLADAATDGIERIGGKAAGLARLAALDCEVPAGFVVTTDLQRAWMRAQGLQAEVDGLLAAAVELEELARAHAEIEARFAAAELADDDVDRAYDRLAGGDDAPVAVRSSATAEDLADA